MRIMRGVSMSAAERLAEDREDPRTVRARGIEMAAELYVKLGPFTAEQLRTCAKAVEENAESQLELGVARGYRIIAAGLEDERRIDRIGVGWIDLPCGCSHRSTEALHGRWWIIAGWCAVGGHRSGIPAADRARLPLGADYGPVLVP